ncbi:hypothetical protein A2866_04940 [Candidatus Roizmanbacteria bacterium RIFCSPHIGHO2_01_FULL_39_8]|uniref:Glycosyltransferase 2-like domain-containing protein n=2 Tax=Candidatus Roizmaniibacteriota TaxID=1752723 RepID=A0A1F7GPI9_9BACT|nr:MAG: hypothetical protein A2866_04940 [Candidatus Roizmanbacteria bacterium RIFCSPHIGHO2_01_FULL_39_8]OGK35392.1 MAG: hypothetical protein A3F60_00565 [Candidatus Roizmanbacteria bacterium RIFCSPHIGHO2_12_FULL_39_8]
MPHKLAVITVVYENYTVLQDFLKSLEKQNNKNFTLFVVDLSKNKKSIKATPFETIIISGLNKGYAHGINIGLKKASESGIHFFCILNNDTYFEKDFIDMSMRSLLDHSSSIIGGKIYYAPGYEYHKDRYSKQDLGKVFWYAGGSIDWNHALTPHRGVDEVDRGQYDKVEETGFVNGALMLLDKSAIDKLGYWDETYFLYFEDSDFCIRAKRMGIKLIYDPRIILWHKNSQSTGGPGSKIHEKYQRINRLRFGIKYAPLKTKLHLIKQWLLRQ